MTGKQLKDILYRTGISFTEISKRLGITPQGFNNNLLVNDVKTGLLERICDVLDMDITDFTFRTTPNNYAALPKMPFIFRLLAFYVVYG